MEKIRLLYPLLVASVLTFLSTVHAAELCKQWGEPVKVGDLDGSTISETSGLAVSHVYQDRLYYVNDSGDGPYFYQGSRKGTPIKQIEVETSYPTDVEDLAYGNCLGNQKCLVVGDIGDNKRRRSSIRFIAILETANFGAKVKPWKVVTARYPDGPHNAEAMAMHPNGDLFVVTKDEGWGHEDQISEVFRLPANQWQNSDQNSVLMMEKVGQWNLSLILRSAPPRAKTITGMTIDPSGKRMILLAYENAIELALDLSEPFKTVDQWIAGQTFQIIPLRNLNQQEAISFSQFEPGHLAFIYNTEKKPGDSTAPQYEVTCRN